MARYSCFWFVLFNLIICSSCNSQPALATEATDNLTAIFGSPESFVTSFEATVKDKADEIVGLLVAAFGFSIVIKKF